ncbi:hypothetical protein ECC18A13_p11450 (plasmid) [Enterobacter sp. 18A13]|nr:hypothetical protein ECC18A13_p11450 [Enterobacter sp. 18A13]
MATRYASNYSHSKLHLQASNMRGFRESQFHVRYNITSYRKSPYERAKKNVKQIMM